MEDPKEKQETGKRVGVHPMVVIFGVIFGIWIFIQAIIPKSKDIQPPQGPGSISVESQLLEEAGSTLVPTFKVTATVLDMNAVSILVPQETTESQIIALLYFLRDARRDGTLASFIPPTSLNDPHDQFSIADMYIFSDSSYAVVDAIQILAIGAHAPGEFYSPTIPYEVAMKHVRGHFTVNLNDKVTPEKGSLGFGEEATGLYSKRFKVVF